LREGDEQTGRWGFKGGERPVAREERQAVTIVLGRFPRRWRVAGLSMRAVDSRCATMKSARGLA
jgi:hypothetical protein